MTAYVMSYLLHRGDDDIDMETFLCLFSWSGQSLDTSLKSQDTCGVSGAQ